MLIESIDLRELNEPIHRIPKIFDAVQNLIENHIQENGLKKIQDMSDLTLDVLLNSPVMTATIFFSKLGFEIIR